MSKSPPDSNKPSAYSKALGLLARREHSARELKTKLTRGGYEGDESLAAVDALQDNTYQSEQRFAEAMARHRAGQGYGPRRIRAELKTHAIDDATIDGAITAADCDWRASAQQQLQRRYGRAGSSDLRERARRAAFLLRRGFDGATVSALTRADVGDPADEFD